MFSYVNATDEELVAHIESMSSAAVSVVKTYHTKHNNEGMVKRIEAARNYIKLNKLKQQVRELEEELRGFNGIED